MDETFGALYYPRFPPPLIYPCSWPLALVYTPIVCHGSGLGRVT